jgi:hypothetical protein
VASKHHQRRSHAPLPSCAIVTRRLFRARCPVGRRAA